MISYDNLIGELSELCGILPEYWDIFGKRHITSIETKKAILLAMKLPDLAFNTGSAEDIAREISEQRKKPWKDFVEPGHVISVNSQPLTIPVYIPIKEGDEDKIILSWSIEDEKGHKEGFKLSGSDITISELKWIDDIRYIKVNLIDNLTDMGQRDLGYYSVNVECRHHEDIFLGGANFLSKTTKVIITPDTCYVPSKLLAESQIQKGITWGVSINLYSIRSDRNWGVGDFSDLKTIVKWIAGLKGDFIGINPLHALSNTKPYGASPYSPISRLYRNFIYLDIEHVPDVKESSIVMSRSLKRELDELRNKELIDYEGVALVKERVLKSAFNFFYKRHYEQDTHRGRDFKIYLLKEGAALESFATYMALFECEMQKADYNYGMKNKAVYEFKKANKKKILFYKYIQWLIDKQLEEVSEQAKASGMTVGLYHDLAIGSVGGGGDAWAYQNVIGLADVGAPPDDFSPNGQNWGFPPLIPEKLKETGYELFIQTIRKNMNYGGALRIDHAPGIFRLFWIPHNMPPKEGAYVIYPSEDLLRIIALESVRNKTIVIAEDLGTVGEGVRETLGRFRMLSYRLFYFERNYPDPSFVLPERYPEMALCAVTTHDLPTLYGYWAGQDLKIKRELGMYPDETLWQQRIDDRARDRALILSALRSQGIIPDDYPLNPEMTPELCSAIYRYLAKTPCKLLLVSLDDIVGAINQQNMPGTIDEHPNWIQKTLFTLEEMVSDKRFEEVACQIRQR